MYLYKQNAVETFKIEKEMKGSLSDRVMKHGLVDRFLGFLLPGTETLSQIKPRPTGLAFPSKIFIEESR